MSNNKQKLTAFLKTWKKNKTGIHYPVKSRKIPSMYNIRHNRVEM